MATKLSNHLEINKLLHIHQFGFRKKLSTEHNLLHLTNYVSNALNEDDFCIGIFLDLKKAFDVVPHCILIKKLKKALRGESVELISHFTTNKGEIWIESFISPVKVGEVDVQEIAFIAHNITEKVENEKKIIESEENNRATVSAIPDMLFKIDKKGYFIDYRLNELGENLLDKFANTQDLIGKHISSGYDLYIQQLINENKFLNEQNQQFMEKLVSVKLR